MTYALQGEAEASLACVRRADELLGEGPSGPLTQAWLASIECLAGRPQRAIDTLARMRESAADSFVDAFPLAELEFFLGHRDRTLSELERAFEQRSPVMVYLLQCRPFFMRSIADEPRFRAIIERMGFPVSEA